VDTIAFGTPEGTIEDRFGDSVEVPVAPGPLADLPVRPAAMPSRRGRWAS
jgi:hypothetical protein